MDAPPDRFVDIAELRLVVADDPKLELRLVCEEIGAHEPGGDRVSTGYRLEPGLRPMPTGFGFVRDHQPHAVQHGEIGGVLIGMARHEGRHGGHRRVVGPDGDQRVDEHAFAVGAGAVEEKHDVFGGEAAEAIACGTLQVLLQLNITAGDFIEERSPERDIDGVRRHRRAFGDVVLFPSFIIFACSQVHCHAHAFLGGVPKVSRSEFQISGSRSCRGSLRAARSIAAVAASRASFLSWCIFE